jgi:hypothetical protein
MDKIFFRDGLQAGLVQEVDWAQHGLPERPVHFEVSHDGGPTERYIRADVEQDGAMVYELHAATHGVWPPAPNVIYLPTPPLPQG